MAMQLKEIEDLIKESFPDAIVEIQIWQGMEIITRQQ